MIVKNAVKTGFIFKEILMAITIISLSACSSPEPKPAPEPIPVATAPKVEEQVKPPVPKSKKVSINFIPSNDLNTHYGKSYPLRVVVYQLKSTHNFNAQTFRAITDNEKQSLKEDVVTKDEWRFKPAESPRTEVIEDISPDTKYLGFIAYYMDIKHAKWQVSYKLTKQDHDKISVSLTDKKIIIK